jgi:peptidoglycan/LPS O-acetylase OafA/YrhL
MGVAGDGGREAGGATLGERLARNDGVGPGFDFLRIALAFSILFAHSAQIASGAASPDNNPLWIGIYLQVPMFFTLSGFLVAGSATRLSLRNFLLSRALRIYPALITEIALSIFFIGLAFTTVSYAQFFSSKEFYLYLTNLVGVPHYLLPGVFEHNPLRYKVNGSLWTVPFELTCYLIMTLLISTRIVHAPRKLLIFTAFAVMIALDRHIWSAMDSTQPLTFAYFCCGVACYQYRERIPYRKAWFALCLGALAALSSLGAAVSGAVWFHLVALPIGVYVTLFLGLTRLPLPKFLTSGDYSYGVYLYGFPVQQAVEQVTGGASTWVNLAIAAPLVFLWSKFSWRMVEKPALSLRKHLARADAAPGPAPGKPVAAPPSRLAA